MTLDDISRLKEVCAKATPGPWIIHLNGLQQSCGVGTEDYSPLNFSGGGPWDDEGLIAPDAAYVATFNPTQVAELLELAEAAKYYQRKLRHIHRAGNVGDLDRCAKCGLDIRDPIHQRAEEAHEPKNPRGA